ncbi:ATP-binding protein [Myxococcota bacterium]|nr:ATP-binding protein [Myxococcota bacterium]
MVERPGRVLVVDDSEDDHQQLRRLLRAEFTVVPAYSASEALERAIAEPFDALITDQKMPRTSGDELIRSIKADERTRSLPCILLSGKTSDEQLVEILRGGGVFHYFEKNDTLLTKEGRAELQLAIRNAVQASHLERERATLTARLRTQVDALSGQYKLLRTLVELRDPARILDSVLASLVERIDCRGAVGIVDLTPGQGAFSSFVTRAGVTPPPGADDAQVWETFAAETYHRLSGRLVSEHTVVRRPSGLASGEFVAAPREPPYMPVFVSRDLRGLLVLLRDTPLEADEHDLMQIWRDQLQDALTRVFTQHMNEHRRLELMVEAMTEGVVMTDETGTVTVMNPAVRRLLGFSEADRPDFAVILDGLGLSSLEILREFGPGETRGSWREVRLGEADCQVTFSPVHNHAGAFVGWLAVIRDVTEQKAAEKRRDDFVHIIGHELRSPMTSIVGVLDLLAKHVLGELTERQREYVDMARDSCARINMNLNDLLDLAKFERGKMPLAIESIHLDEVVSAAARKFGAAAIERRVELRIHAPVQGLICDADGHRLSQVVNNLVSNALKFTPAGGLIEVQVLSSFTIPDQYLVTVRNSGEEIPEKDLDRIFDKFEQVGHGDGRRSLGGTGLGLTICRSIVEGHGGRIWAESGPSFGTMFVFSVPTQQAREQEVAALLAQPTDDRHRNDEPPVLVIAEDPTEGLAVKAALLAQGFPVKLCDATPADVGARVAALRPALAVYVDPEPERSRALLPELAGSAAMPVAAIVPTGGAVEGPVDATIELPLDADTLGSVLELLLLRQRQLRRMRLLVCDRDAALAGQWAQMFDEAGYLAYTAHVVSDALRRLDVLLPDLVIVDLGLPDVLRLAERFARDEPDGIPLVFVGAQAAPRAPAPWPNLPVLARDAAPRELLLQVRGRLSQDARTRVDALIILPGPRELEREVQARLRDAVPFGYCAIDIEGLREAVERHGFMWGHNVLSRTAELVRRVIRERGGEGAFLGHQRDDDFVFLVEPERVDAVCREIRRAFDRLLPIIAESKKGADLKLQMTAVVDEGGRFERFTAIQNALSLSRRRGTGEPVLIDRDRRTLG